MFNESQFVPTQWDSAADKVKFADHFVKFVESDFDKNKFPKWFYSKLSMIGHHIAHYDLERFYSEWFGTGADRLNFIRHWLNLEVDGDPSYCYSDVESKLKAWLQKGNWESKQVRRSIHFETKRNEQQNVQIKQGMKPV